MISKSVRDFVVTVLLLLAAASCTPVEEFTPSVEEIQDVAAGSQMASEDTTPSSAIVNNATSEDQIVEVTPMSEEELSRQPAGQTESGPGESGNGSDSVSVPGEEEEIVADNWPVYVDDTYKFSVAYAPDYVVRSLDSSKLSGYNPTPLTSIRFMSPSIANSDVGDLDIPQFEVRIYAVDQVDSLEGWLLSAGLVAEGDLVEAYQEGNINGVKACLSTLLWPNCSIFVANNDWVYQLIPSDPIGETMVRTFVFVP